MDMNDIAPHQHILLWDINRPAAALPSRGLIVKYFTEAPNGRLHRIDDNTDPVSETRGP